jgi:hypothetical protein
MGNVLTALQALMVAAALAGAPQQAGSTPTPTEAPAGSQGTERPVDLPVSFDRIQEALSRPRAINPRTDRPVFRIEVFSRPPTIEDILGPDYLRGPVPMGGSMSHQEFLNMVTPVEFRGMSMFSNKEAMTIVATSLALQWALMKSIDKLKDATTDRAREAAKQEVARAMNELEAARKKAGLPPR